MNSLKNAEPYFDFGPRNRKWLRLYSKFGSVHDTPVPQVGQNQSVMAGVSSLFNGQHNTQLDGEWKLKVHGSVFVTLAIGLTFVDGWVGTAIVSEAAG